LKVIHKTILAVKKKQNKKTHTHICHLLLDYDPSSIHYFTKKKTFFFPKALSRVRRRRGVLGTLGLLDGTAWIRTVRRDTSEYKTWLKAK